METTYKNCPACDEPIKEGFFTKNLLLSPHLTSFINRHSKNPKPAYCDKCGKPQLIELHSHLDGEKKIVSEEIKKIQSAIQILTINAPIEWKIKPIGMVTSQIAIGTGALTELSASFSDFLGRPSNALGGKIAYGEELCKAQLRVKCLNMGGNAIIGADIDYSELGPPNNMIMVAIQGTAVKVTNYKEVFEPERTTYIDSLMDLMARKRSMDG